MNRRLFFTELPVAILLFSLALWLRSANLTHFVTADEHNWVYRSGVFLYALLQRDWKNTSVWLTPGVTTTWLGSLGLLAYHQTHQAAINQPLTEWLRSLPRNRVDLEILLYLRWAMALFTSAMVAVTYILARKLWTLPLALLGTLFVLLSPHLLAVSRIIGHDAPATFFSFGSILAFLAARRNRLSKVCVFYLFLSGILAGFAVLSKTTTLFLLPFVVLLAFTDVWQKQTHFRKQVACLSLWVATLWLVFILFWPAAWVNPSGQIWAVVSNAFLSSAGLEDPDIQPFWSIPNLSVFYYLINGALKLSPLVLLGTGLCCFRLFTLKHIFTPNSNPQTLPPETDELFWLLLYALLFGVFMTFGVKKSPRYILPAFPALAFVAAWGWLYAARRYQTAIILGLGTASLLLTLNYAPYYFTYFNPLLGGSYIAPQIVRIGWGEGLDEVGRWLNQTPHPFADRLGTRYTVTAEPFYEGEIASPVRDELDYVAFYIKQSQSGYPSPEILAYFEEQGALHNVTLNGIEYAQVYKGPGMQLIKKSASLNLPIAFRPHTIYAPIGKTLTVDLLWPANFATGKQDNLAILSLSGKGLAAPLNSQATIQMLAENVIVSQHHFAIPPDLPRSDLTLLLNNESVGQLKARQMTAPSSMNPASYVFANQIKLAGWQAKVQKEAILVSLAWQAFPKASNDYTVFVQILNQNGDRVAGVDALPTQGFTVLDCKEMMLADYTLSLPANLPAGEYTLLAGLYYFAGDELMNVGQAVLDRTIQLP